MPLLGEEDGMRHGRIVPLPTVPNLVHGSGVEIAGRRGITADASGDRPSVFLFTVNPNGHLRHKKCH